MTCVCVCSLVVFLIKCVSQGEEINLRCEKKKQAQNVGTQCAVSNERMLSAGLDGVTGWAAVWLSCGSVDDVL